MASPLASHSCTFGSHIVIARNEAISCCAFSKCACYIRRLLRRAGNDARFAGYFALQNRIPTVQECDASKAHSRSESRAQKKRQISLPAIAHNALHFIYCFYKQRPVSVSGAAVLEKSGLVICGINYFIFRNNK